MSTGFASAAKVALADCVLHLFSSVFLVRVLLDSLEGFPGSLVSMRRCAVDLEDFLFSGFLDPTDGCECPDIVDKVSIVVNPEDCVAGDPFIRLEVASAAESVCSAVFRSLSVGDLEVELCYEFRLSDLSSV